MIDTPGLNNKNVQIIELCNKINLIVMLQHAKSVKIVVVCNAGDKSARS